MRPPTMLAAFILSALIAAIDTGTPMRAADAEARIANRVKTPGVLQLQLRSRDKRTGEPGVETAAWRTAETAIIVCDMWDDHYCQLAAQRVGVMAPRMNRVLSAARSHGVMIIHAPSGCMDVYADTPYRQRMQQASEADPPVPIGRWCYLDPEVEPALPIKDDVSPCDDPVVGERVRRYSRQHAALDIIGYDGVSDSGTEIYNYCRQEGIKNIVLMGVHTNMCVLGRPFGIRQQVRLGMNVVLCRDLTDAMYDPREPPYVSHDRGTQLVVEHIERYWCPSITASDLTTVIPSSADPAETIDPAQTDDETDDETTVEPGTIGEVGCGPDAQRVPRLVIAEPGVYENYLVDGQWTDSTLVKINADNVVLRNCEIRNGTHNAITVYADNVLIESCKIHHVLSGTFEQQDDAHGITGRPNHLVIRNCDIGLTSGDSIQFDPGRGPWDDVLIEHCNLWTAPLPADAAAFRKGQRPGENGIDLKQQVTNPRSRMTVRHCLLYGWNQPGPIGNMAAMNLKNHVQVNVAHCLLRDNEIGFRIRGGDGDLGGARVTIKDCIVHDSMIAVRVEDRPLGFQVRQLGIGPGVDRVLQAAGSGSRSDYPGFDYYKLEP